MTLPLLAQRTFALPPLRYEDDDGSCSAFSLLLNKLFSLANAAQPRVTDRSCHPI